MVCCGEVFDLPVDCRLVDLGVLSGSWCSEKQPLRQIALRNYANSESDKTGEQPQVAAGHPDQPGHDLSSQRLVGQRN